MVTICYKNEKILKICGYYKIFAFTSEAHITEKFTLPKQIVNFFVMCASRVKAKILQKHQFLKNFFIFVANSYSFQIF